MIGTKYISIIIIAVLIAEMSGGMTWQSVRGKDAPPMLLGHITTDTGVARGVAPTVSSPRTLTPLQETIVTYTNIRLLGHVVGAVALNCTVITPKIIVFIQRGPMEA